MTGLQIALSALRAHQQGLDVTAHNIANALTEGYSRQRVDTSADSGPITPALHARWPEGGFGVAVESISRVYDAFLEARALLEHGADAALGRTANTLDRLEALFDEPSDRGIGALFGEFWSGWQDVANHPDDLAAREQLLERSRAVTGAITKAAAGMEAMRASTIDQLSTLVTEVNTIATNVATLNRAIENASIAGLSNEDLLDQRDLLVRQLADRTGITVRIQDHGVVDVYLGGTALVRGSESTGLTLDVSGSAVVVRRAADGYPTDIESGDVGGLLESVNEIIPRYLANLDQVANELRTSVNGVHAALGGTIAPGAQDLTAAGVLSFGLQVNGVALADVAVTGADWSGPGGAAALQTALQTALDTSAGPGVVTATVTGGNGAALVVSLAPAAPTDLVTVARVAGDAGLATFLSDVAVGLDGIGGRAFFSGTGAADLELDPTLTATTVGAAAGAGGLLDGSAASRVSQLDNDSAGATARYRAFIVGMGVEVQASSRRTLIQTDVTEAVDSAREGAAGVNLDEEMIAMVALQHAYNASARFLTAIDEVLSTLVERTGRVGA